MISYVIWALLLASVGGHAGTRKIAPIQLLVGEVSGNLLLIDGDAELFAELRPAAGGTGASVSMARMAEFRDSLNLRFWPRDEKRGFLRRLNPSDRRIEELVFEYSGANETSESIVPERVSLTKFSKLVVSIYGARVEASLDGSGARVRVPEGESANGYLRPEAYTEIALEGKLADRARPKSRAGFHEVRTLSDFLSCIEGLALPSQRSPVGK